MVEHKGLHDTPTTLIFNNTKNKVFRMCHTKIHSASSIGNPEYEVHVKSPILQEALLNDSPSLSPRRMYTKNLYQASTRSLYELTDIVLYGQLDILSFAF